MSELAPLEVLYEAGEGEEVRLPPTLGWIYGRLALPTGGDRPHVIANFVETLDGVTSLAVPGHAAGGDISGFNEHDRLVMAILRAISGAVVVGAGTLRSVPRHVWTPDYVYPSLSEEYSMVRTELGMAEAPLNVIVTAGGEIDPTLRVFQGGEAPVLIVTTEGGAERLARASLPESVSVQAAPGEGDVRAEDVLAAVTNVAPSRVVLVEGGPSLLGDFFAERLVDELFLTLAPQVAGRDGAVRPGLVAGRTFAPDDPRWSQLVSVRRAGSHLFLRYAFER